MLSSSKTNQCSENKHVNENVCLWLFHELLVHMNYKLLVLLSIFAFDSLFSCESRQNELKVDMKNSWCVERYTQNEINDNIMTTATFLHEYFNCFFSTIGAN